MGAFMQSLFVAVESANTHAQLSAASHARDIDNRHVCVVECNTWQSFLASLRLNYRSLMWSVRHSMEAVNTHVRGDDVIFNLIGVACTRTRHIVAGGVWIVERVDLYLRHVDIGIDARELVALDAATDGT